MRSNCSRKVKSQAHRATIRIFTIHAITIASVFFLSCSSPSFRNQTNFGKSCHATSSSNKQLCECAANSLYSMCSKSDIPISHQLCMELLPPKQQGNNMLEFKAALLSLGFQVEAQKLSVDELANTSVPTVFLLFTPESLELAGAQPIGHYLVLWPLDKEKVKILNYPHEPVTLSRDYLVKHLHRAGINNAPVLLCSL